MKVNFFDPVKEYHEIKSEIDECLRRVLEGGALILGPEVEKFEHAFARYLDVKYCVGVASGTDALYLALLACGVGPGDEVITVSHTMVATTLAILRTGAKPVFADVDPLTYTMDVNKAGELVTPRTKAILPVHIYGQCADMDPIMTLAKDHALWVIEDACQAAGAVYRTIKAGTLGHVGCFSFYPTKNLGCYGDGGAVVTNDSLLAQKLRLLRNYGKNTEGYYVDLGINSRLDEMQAAILNVKLRYLDNWNSKRRRIAEVYTESLRGTSFQVPHELLCGEHVYHLYVVQTEARDAVKNRLAQRGVQTMIHYPAPVHLQPAYRVLGYQKGSLPVTESVTDRILSLPICPTLTENEVEYVWRSAKEIAELCEVSAL